MILTFSLPNSIQVITLFSFDPFLSDSDIKSLPLSHSALTLNHLQSCLHTTQISFFFHKKVEINQVCNTQHNSSSTKNPVMMNNFDPQRQDSLKRRWQERRQIMGAPSNSSSLAFFGNNHNNKFQGFPVLEDDDFVSTVVPAVTVVLEGRSICQRISLHNHASYQSLAKALRQMFVDGNDAGESDDLDLSNAIPGHLIAYEDMENDLLLAGDLSWKDFVRVAKRIRILPAKGNSRKGTTSTRPEDGFN